MRRYRDVFSPQKSSVVCQGNLSPVWSSWADLTILEHEVLENSARWGVSGQNCVIQPSTCTLCSAKRPWRVPLQKTPPFMSREWFLWWTSGKINLTANLCHLLMYFTKGDSEIPAEKFGRWGHHIQTQVDSWTVTWLSHTSYSLLLSERKKLFASLLKENSYFLWLQENWRAINSIKQTSMRILLHVCEWIFTSKKNCCIQKKGGSKQKGAI